MFGNDGINLLAINILVFIQLLVLLWQSGGVYKNWLISVLFDQSRSPVAGYIHCTTKFMQMSNVPPSTLPCAFLWSLYTYLPCSA